MEEVFEHPLSVAKEYYKEMGEDLMSVVPAESAASAWDASTQEIEDRVDAMVNSVNESVNEIPRNMKGNAILMRAEFMQAAESIEEEVDRIGIEKLYSPEDIESGMQGLKDSVMPYIQEVSGAWEMYKQSLDMEKELQAQIVGWKNYAQAQVEAFGQQAKAADQAEKFAATYNTVSDALNNAYEGFSKITLPIAELNEQLRFQDDMAVITSLISKASDPVNRLSLEMQKLTMQTGQFKEQMAALETSLSASGAAYDRLKQQIAGVDAQIRQLQLDMQATQAAEGDTSGMQEQLLALKQQREDLRVQAEATKQSMESERETLQGLKTGYDELNTSLETTQTKYLQIVEGLSAGAQEWLFSQQNAVEVLRQQGVMISDAAEALLRKKQAEFEEAEAIRQQTAAIEAQFEAQNANAERLKMVFEGMNAQQQEWLLAQENTTAILEQMGITLDANAQKFLQQTEAQQQNTRAVRDRADAIQRMIDAEMANANALENTFGAMSAAQREWLMAQDNSLQILQSMGIAIDENTMKLYQQMEAEHAETQVLQERADTIQNMMESQKAGELREALGRLSDAQYEWVMESKTGIDMLERMGVTMDSTTEAIFRKIQAEYKDAQAMREKMGIISPMEAQLQQYEQILNRLSPKTQEYILQHGNLAEVLRRYGLELNDATMELIQKKEAEWEDAKFIRDKVSAIEGITGSTQKYTSATEQSVDAIRKKTQAEDEYTQKIIRQREETDRTTSAIRSKMMTEREYYEKFSRYGVRIRGHRRGDNVEFSRYGVRIRRPESSAFHSGGPVPRRFHSGGLASDEVPAVLQTGEYVLSRRDVKSIKSNRPDSVLNKVRSARYHNGGMAGGGMGGGQVVQHFTINAKVVDRQAFQEFTRQISQEQTRQQRLRIGGNS
jgi:hypothetical protein